MGEICVNSFSLSFELPNFLFPQYGGDKISLLEFPRICDEELGLRNVELCQMQFPSIEPSYIKRLNDALKGSHIRVVNICIDDGTTSEPDPEKRKKEFAFFRQWFLVARELGSASVRINPDHPLPSAQTEGGEEAIRRAISGYKELSKTAEETGVRLLVENHGPGMTINPDNIIRIVREVGSNHFGVIADFGNFPPKVKDEGLQKLTKYSTLVHAKIFPLNDLGEKILKHCVEIVRQNGFDGYYSIEIPPIGKFDQREAVRKAYNMLEKYI
jgi:sugar phosphate isomerase/epimerase